MSKARYEEQFNETTRTKEKMIQLKDTQILFPHLVKSQEDWDTLWPQLKDAGYSWSEGDELDKFFSDCYDFPEFINVNEEGSKLLVIEDSEESPLDDYSDDEYLRIKSGEGRDMYDDDNDDDDNRKMWPGGPDIDDFDM